MNSEIGQVNNRPKRYPYIDTMKAWAILCVVMGHLLIFSLYDVKDNSPLFGLIYSFHLPLFALASGLVTDVSNFKIAKRIKIIYPIIFIGLPYSYLIGKDLSYFIHDDMKCGYWWLWLMVVFYVCLYAMKMFNIKLLLGFAFFELVFSICSKVLPEDIVSILCVKSCVGLWPWLCLGIFLRKRNLMYILKLKWHVIILIGLSWLVCFYTNGMIHIKGFHYIVSLLGVAFFVGLFYNLDNKRITKWGGVFGKYSLQIYVIHYFFIQIFQIQNFGYWLNSHNLRFLDFIICPLLSVAISLLCVLASRGFAKLKLDWIFGR